MPLRYFTRASSVFLYLIVFASAFAQKPAATPIPGYIRFWNMLPPTGGAFDLRKVGASPTEPAISSNATAYVYSSYSELPKGGYRLGVYESGDQTSPLKVFALTVTPNSFFTILVGPSTMDLINDTVDPKATSDTITVRNYFPGSTVDICSGAKTVATALAYGQSFVLKDLVAKDNVALRSRLPTGKAAEFKVNPDFRTSRHATILVIPDSYGRFRPMVTMDGTNE